ncbi:MAG: hypothetical protein ACREQM_11740, partial [Candidatus Dormibacteraceae bacterium]
MDGSVCNAKELCEFPKLDLALHHGWISPEATGVIIQTLKRVREHCPERVSDVGSRRSARPRRRITSSSGAPAPRSSTCSTAPPP